MRKVWANKYWLLSILGIVIFIIFLPVLLDTFIFGNKVYSNIENADWASFFGSYLGGVIGGGCTCAAVLLQKFFTDKEKEKDMIAAEEEKKNDQLFKYRPYIAATEPTCAYGSLCEFKILNMGMNSARDIGVFVVDSENKDIQIGNGTYCLTVNKYAQVRINPLEGSYSNYRFHYIDLLNNLYYQDFKYDKESNSFISMQPVLIKNLFENYSDAE